MAADAFIADLIDATRGADAGRAGGRVRGPALTWRALATASTASRPRSAGSASRAGDKVAILAPASVEYVASLPRRDRRRRLRGPLPASASADALRAMLLDSDAKVLLLGAEPAAARRAFERELADRLRGD